MQDQRSGSSPIGPRRGGRRPTTTISRDTLAAAGDGSAGSSQGTPCTAILTRCNRSWGMRELYQPAKRIVHRRRPHRHGGRRPDRGRDAHYWAPPAQNRTCGFPAYGSHLGCLAAKRTCSSPHASQCLGHAFPVLCPARAASIRVPLGPCPSLHRLRRRFPGPRLRTRACPQVMSYTELGIRRNGKVSLWSRLEIGKRNECVLQRNDRSHRAASAT